MALPAPSGYCELACLNPKAPLCRGRKCVIRGSMAGEKAATEQLFEQLYASIRRYAAILCPRPEDAEDLTQETLALAFAGLPELRQPRQLLHWLRTIARHRHLERLRLHHSEPRTFEMVQEEISPCLDPDPQVQVMTRETALRLASAIRSLPPSLRSAFHARVIDGLSTRDAAQRLGTTEAAVRTRLRRARVLLRFAL